MDKVKVFRILYIYVLVIGCQVLHGDVEIIAHRGASDTAPENTVAAFNQAWKEESDAAECDIHLTKDNKIVVIHDGSTKFTTGIDLKVRDVNSDEIRKLDAGKFKHPRFTGEKIPFLDEVINTIPPYKKLFIEIKCGQEVLPYLKDVIEKSGKKQQLTIIGFDLTTLIAAKKIMPDIPVYWLVGRKEDKSTGRKLPYDPNLVDTAKKAGIDGLDAHSQGMTRQFAEAAHIFGQKLYVWTVDDANEVKYLRGIGVDGITTNKPAIVRSIVQPITKTSITDTLGSKHSFGTCDDN